MVLWEGSTRVLRESERRGKYFLCLQKRGCTNDGVGQKGLREGKSLRAMLKSEVMEDNLKKV